MWLDDLVTVLSAQPLEDRVLEALYARGVTDEQIALFRMGHLDRHLPDLEYPEAFLNWCHRGAKLDDVIVLPLTNTLGEVKGLQFRHVERDRSGYLDYLPEKAEAVLFGLGQAMSHIWLTHRVLLVEGAFDLFPIQRHFPAVVATLTAHVWERLVRILRRANVRDIWLGYDTDETGRRSSESVLKEHGKEFRVHVLQYPRIKMVGGKLSKDPSDLWEAQGEEAFSTLIRRLIGTGSSLETV